MQVPVSVIIPHYNRPGRIGRAIASVRAQTLQPAEIVVVDDCSKPECRQDLKRFEGVARIIWLPNNGGLSNARNEGARAAQCETIAFLDDDDEWLPEKLEKQWALLQANPDLIASTTAALVVDTNTGETTDVLHRHSAPSITLPMALEATPAMVQTLVIRKSAFFMIGGFDVNLRCIEDQELLIRLAASGLPNGHLAELLCRYHLGGSDHISSRMNKMLGGRLAVIKKHRLLYEQVFGPEGPRLARGAHLRWAGVQWGGVKGRAAFAYGAWLGRDWKAMTRLALTGKMRGPEYSYLHGGPAEQPFQNAPTPHG